MTSNYGGACRPRVLKIPRGSQSGDCRHRLYDGQRRSDADAEPHFFLVAKGEVAAI